MGKPVDVYGRDMTSPLAKVDTLLAKSSTAGTDEQDTYSAESLDLVAAPYDLKFLSDLNDISVTRRSCIEAKATNVAALGYRIKRVDPAADETDRDDVSDQIKLQLERWAAKGGSPFAQAVYNMLYDLESNGNGYLEVSRNRRGEIDGIYNIPSHTIRIKKDRSGFVQVLSNGVTKVPFYNFGDKCELKEDGTIEILPDRDRKINELIHFKLDTHKSAYYGLPVDIAALPTIIGDEAAREYNNKFFKFSATPELALIFEVDATAIPTLYGDQPIKVEIDPNTKRDIEEHFRRNLSAKTFEPAIFHLPPGVKMRVEKLSSEQKDSGWTKFREANKAEIREAHRTPPVVVGGSDTNYANAAIEKSVYLEQVIAPRQEEMEQTLMALLWPELVMIGNKQLPAELAADGDLSINPVIRVSPENGVGVDPTIWRLDFKEMSVADKSVDAQVHNIYATLGVMTINEIRMQLGMKPLPEGDKTVKPKPGAEGNAAAQNAQMMQASAGNPELMPFVSNMAPQTAQKVDITGLGNGRGPNGQITPKMPRRPGDQGGFNAANMLTAGSPLQKEDIVPDEQVVIPKAYLDELLGNQKDN
jgi:PBSX family phage portal protein